jgi:pimeloyl-ACP methyl ester carboxylesterase
MQVVMRSLGEAEILIEVAGSPMKVVDSGQGDVVVLGHSYLWDAEMWRPQINALSRYYRVIVPELWGHGGSGRLPQGTQDLRGVALQYLELLDRLRISRFSIVGLSVGGMWGAELALAAPKRVRSIALMGTYLGVEPEAARRSYLAMLDAVEATHEIPEAILNDLVRMFFSPYIGTWAPQLVWKLRSRLEKWHTDRLLDSVAPIGRMIFGRRRTLTELAQLAIPKLVMHGAQDIPRPIHEARQMSELLACRLIELAGAGHISSLEVPDDVTSHLLAFLGQVHGIEHRPDSSAKAVPATMSAADGY